VHTSDVPCTPLCADTCTATACPPLTVVVMTQIAVGLSDKSPVAQADYTYLAGYTSLAYHSDVQVCSLVCIDASTVLCDTASICI
jgi:hypothetical protein